MNKKIARYTAMGVCIVSTILLFTRTINPIVAGIIFIASLIVFGLLSKGFKTNDSGNTDKK